VVQEYRDGQMVWDSGIIRWRWTNGIGIVVQLNRDGQMVLG